MASDTGLIIRRVARILRVDTVSLSDNFFDLGGDSLAALELADVLSEATGREVDLQRVLGAATFGDLLRDLQLDPPGNPADGGTAGRVEVGGLLD
ncbi:phosphopantetheine-binding protein [Cellulomonas sp. URHB0016]